VVEQPACAGPQPGLPVPPVEPVSAGRLDRTGLREVTFPTDSELIEWSMRDPGCFAAIFDRHADAILRYASSRLGPEVAEDVTAETFLAAFRRRCHYDTSRRDARPWLYGIAARQIGKHRRAEIRRLRMLGSIPAELLTEDFSDRSVDQVTARQFRPSSPRCCPACRPRPGIAVANRLGRAELRRGRGRAWHNR